MALPTRGVSDSEDGSRCLLHPSSLSFYDPFRVVTGVPAFLLTPPEPKNGRSSEDPDPNVPVFLTHPSLVTCCCFSRDGRRLATGHFSGAVCLWDADHGELLSCKEAVHDDPVCDVAFREDSHDVVLTADRKGNCRQLRGTVVVEKDGSPQWRDDADDLASVHGQSARFFSDGNLLVLAAKVETFRMGSGSYMMNTPNPKMLFCVMDTRGQSESHCIAKLGVEVEIDDVVTHLGLSPDGTGLLVGFIDSAAEAGYTVLWPDFLREPDFCVPLKYGTLSDWAPDSGKIVTWTAPEEPFPEDNHGSCAFLFDVRALRLQMGGTTEGAGNKLEGLQPVVLMNPKGKNVLWCHFLLNEESKSRLVMCAVRTTARLLFWDVDTQLLTHVIPTGISTNDVNLGSRACWKMCWGDGLFVKGLKPLKVTSDMKWMGAVSGHQNKAMIWDAVQGVELLNLALPQDLSDAVGGAVDLVMSPIRGKFAIVGYRHVVAFSPAAPAVERALSSNHQMVQLEYVDPCNVAEKQMKMMFSSNGQALAVLHVGSSLLHLWNLSSPLELHLNCSSGKERDVELVDFALAPLFCLSHRRAAYVALYTASRQILLWECLPDAAVLVGAFSSHDHSICRAIGLMQDNRAVVICNARGNLVWYFLHEHRGQHGPSVSSCDKDENCTLPEDSVRQTKTWKGRSFVSEQMSGIRKFKSDIAGSHHPASGYRFSVVGRDEVEGNGTHACRFSADCRMAVLMSNPWTVCIWDLEERCVLRDLRSAVGPSSVPGPPPPFLPSCAIPHTISADPELMHNLNGPLNELGIPNPGLLSERNVEASENADVFLLACVDDPTQGQGSAVHVPDRLFMDEELMECDAFYVIHAKHPETTRRLSGKRLQPGRGMAISADGRFVACASKGTKKSEIFVWNCYAMDALLPCFHSLQLKGRVQNKQSVLQYLPSLLRDFAGNLINYVHSNGASLLFEAVFHTNDEVLDATLQFAAQNKIKVSLESDDIDYQTAVQLALDRRSPEIASKLMKYLIQRVTYDPQMARILKRCLIAMNTDYPKIVVKALHHPELFSTRADLAIPEVLFGRNRFAESTSDRLHLTEAHANEMWDIRRQEMDTYNKTGATDYITTTVVHKVLPYPDACKIGEGGLLRSLLVAGASDSCFASFAVKAIVTHKWRKYGGRLLLWELLNYSLLLFCFTVYSFALSYQETYNVISREGDEAVEWETMLPFGICWILTVPKLAREFVQTSVYWREYGWRGIYYWLKSAWNWLEMLCYGMIVVVLPIGQYWFLREGRHTITLSVLVAFEAILLWCKMLYFLQPFKKTGPLVIIVSAIALDILPFLLLGGCLMFGFSVAFLVLYRHVRARETAEGSDATEDILFSFGHYGKTLFTVAPSQATAICLFVLYMVVIAVIILNMMIAIMSDSFNRIKSTEEMQFIKARAIAIDDIESMLSTRRKRRLEKSIGTYLHVAIPKYSHEKVVKSRRGRGAGMSKDVKKLLRLLTAVLEKEQSQNRRLGTEAATLADEAAGLVLEEGSATSSSGNVTDLGELDDQSSVSFDE